MQLVPQPQTDSTPVPNRVTQHFPLWMRRLTIQHWAWIHFKISLGIMWAGTMFSATPAPIARLLGEPLIPFWMGSTVVGAVVSLTGLVMSAQPKTSRVYTYGVSIELIGLILFSVGPVVYAIAQFGLWAASGNLEDRGALSWFAYSMCSVMLFRFTVVVPRRRREANDPAKDHLVGSQGKVDVKGSEEN